MQAQRAELVSVQRFFLNRKWKRASLLPYHWNMSASWILVQPGTCALYVLGKQCVNKTAVVLRLLLWMVKKMDAKVI